MSEYAPYQSPQSPQPASQKPGKVQAIAVMTLVGGILATVYGFSLFIALAATCIGLLWLPVYYSFVCGIMAIIKGAKLLGQNDRLETPPKATAIMQIVNIINCDVVNLVLGILILVFLSDPEVDGYYQG